MSENTVLSVGETPMIYKPHQVGVLIGYRSFRLSIATVGIIRTLPGTVVTEFRGEREGKRVNRSRAGVTTQIVRHDFLRDVGKLDSEFKEIYRARTKPSPVPGVRRPRYDPDALVKVVAEYAKKRRELGEIFVSRIEEVKAAAKEDFGELYSDDWFPPNDKLLSRFNVTLDDYHSVILDDPNESVEVKNAKVAEMQKQLDEADEQAKEEKRKDFLDKASRLLEELKKGGKRIYESVVEGLKQYCAEFHKEDHPEMAPLVEEVRKILQDKTAEDLRSFKGDLTAALQILEDVVPKAEKLGRIISIV